MYCPITMNGIPQSAMKIGGDALGLCPHRPSAPASQKIAKPPHSRLDGIMYQSFEWKMTDGLGRPAQSKLSPETSSDWSLTDASGSIGPMSSSRRKMRVQARRGTVGCLGYLCATSSGDVNPGT